MRSRVVYGANVGVMAHGDATSADGRRSRCGALINEIVGRFGRAARCDETLTRTFEGSLQNAQPRSAPTGRRLRAVENLRASPEEEEE